MSLQDIVQALVVVLAVVILISVLVALGPGGAVGVSPCPSCVPGQDRASAAARVSMTPLPCKPFLIQAGSLCGAWR